MTVAVQCHVAVDLVGYHDDSFGMAECCETLQRFTRPYDTGWIMRVCQNQHFAFAVADRLQILEIHLVAAVRHFLQGIEYDLSAVLLWHEAERMVHRWLDYDLVVLPEQCVYRHADTLDNAGDIADPFFADVPVMMPGYPVDD